jgi:hypothetical protein
MTPTQQAIDPGASSSPTEPSIAPPSLRLDITDAMAKARPEVREMARAAGVTLQLGVRTREQRLADGVASTEKRDCLGPQKDMVADLVPLAIYLKTIASGKCKGQ